MTVVINENFELVCPSCRNDLAQEKDVFLCSACGNNYPIVNNIPDFRENDEYWCNVSREKMQLLNKLAKDKNGWVGATREIVPEYMEHFQNFLFFFSHLADYAFYCSDISLFAGRIARGRIQKIETTIIPIID